MNLPLDFAYKFVAIGMLVLGVFLAKQEHQNWENANAKMDDLFSIILKESVEAARHKALANGYIQMSKDPKMGSIDCQKKAYEELILVSGHSAANERYLKEVKEISFRYKPLASIKDRPFIDIFYYWILPPVCLIISGLFFIIWLRDDYLSLRLKKISLEELQKKQQNEK